MEWKGEQSGHSSKFEMDKRCIQHIRHEPTHHRILCNGLEARNGENKALKRSSILRALFRVEPIWNEVVSNDRNRAKLININQSKAKIELDLQSRISLYYKLYNDQN